MVATLLLCSTFVAAGKDKAAAFTDPADVTDPDFIVQGEYMGSAAGAQAWGVQVIALGEGSFDFVVYPGGLPGDGWSGNPKDRMKGKGKRDDKGRVILKLSQEGSEARGVIVGKDMKLYPSDKEEEVFASLTKVNRVSPTLDKKPPKGAVVLFDGKNADAWTSKHANVLDGDLLMRGVRSKELFQDFSIHLEFRTPYMPFARGQGRGNSGFYAQGRYEVQILDSFGLEGKDNECGGIYSVGPPRINMCYPPLSWQTYDVDFKAARYDSNGKKSKDAELTVRHNGVTIHQDQVADHSTTASNLKEGPEPGPIVFQDHGNPVRYRNVWVIRK